MQFWLIIKVLKSAQFTYWCILPRVAVYNFFAARMFLCPFGDVIHVSIYGDPSVLLARVLSDLFPWVLLKICMIRMDPTTFTHDCLAAVWRRCSAITWRPGSNSSYTRTNLFKLRQAYETADTYSAPVRFNYMHDFCLNGVKLSAGDPM